MLSCKEVSRLVSESLDRPLPWSRRVSVALHLAMCGLCRRFRGSLLTLRRQARGSGADVEAPVSGRAPRLSDAARRRIRAALRSR